MAMETIGSDLSEHKVWYSLKYNRQILMPVEGDMDVRMIFKGTDEHGYLYVGGVDGLRR